ncbi:MAG: T9SS type A sorting domain-containing protein [Flavobacteriales bacterium]|jgi:hypothetical protein|nr:T9SS type A sorting domain-containing protein [Flavobacteriales bacterium]MDC3260062.1 T9SS type A sorting domain-containing protein [bacterium]
MRNAITFLTLSISSVAFGQFPTDAQETISINNISAAVRTNGSLFQDDLYAGFEVPQNSGTHTIYSGSLWIGGLDANGALHMAAATYVQDMAQDYWPGPVSDSAYYVAADSTWNRLWKVSAQEINSHIWNYWQSTYSIPEAILNWPAHGDISKGQEANLAPFIDANGNGLYEPMQGDYPKIKGDEAVYFIMNDDRLPHTGSNGEQMRIEVHGMVYGFNCANSEALFNTLFIDYKIINRSQYSYDDTFIGFFMDFDIGGYSDDYMACDVNRSSFYAYNGDSLDNPSAGAAGYGTSPPAQSLTFLKGPLQDSDGVDNSFGISNYESINGFGYGDGVADNERIGMDRFISNLAFSTSEPPIGYYNILRGKTSDGTSLTYGGTGFGGIDTCKFMFPKDSDPYNFGTWGTPPSYPFSNGWSEENENNTPMDKRGVGSTGPFTFGAGEMQEITIAFTFAKSDTGNQHSSVALMQQYIDEVRAMYLADATPCGNGVFSTLKPLNNEEQQNLVLYPNPASNVLFIKGTSNQELSYEIYDVTGKLVLRGTTNQNAIEVSNLNSGLYFMNFEGRSHRFIKK